MRTLGMLGLHGLVVFAAACGDGEPAGGGPDAGPGVDGSVDGSSGCVAGYAGAACVLAAYDAAVAGCAPEAVETLRAELEARADLGPLWAGGRVLFRADGPVAFAGAWNEWSTTALVASPVCGGDVIVAVGAVPEGHWPYKVVDGQAWSLDPHNRAFAYDDFAGNADGKNSVLNTPGSGRGHLVGLDRACSAALGNCRDVTAYLPAGYTASDRTYPVLFMHDGQNVWDDHDCCFGHTGWEVNVTLDAEIAEGRVAPLVVIAAAHSTARNNEYGLSPSAMDAFIAFQVTELQPAALAQVRWNGARVAVAGSSLGGLISMHLALRHPETYVAAVSLSGAFWPNNEALKAQLPAYGKQPVGVYLDHGGDVGTNADGAADSVEVRDAMASLGWQVATSPACTFGDRTLCYHAEPGAAHDELAWKARAWRFLRFVSPPQ